jgi:alpha-1,2-mannosyltransferase
MIIWTFAVWAVPHTDSRELSFSAWQIGLSFWYVAFGLVFLALVCMVTRRAASPPATLPAGTESPASTGAASW